MWINKAQMLVNSIDIKCELLYNVKLSKRMDFFTIFC